MSINKGDKAPEFSLKNTQGNEILLSSFKDRSNVILLFFPLAFSSVCTKELCNMRDNMKMFNSLNTKVIAISVDSFFSLKEFKKAQNLSFTLLSDFNKKASKQYGVLYDNFYGMKEVSKRAAFVIDRQGTVIHCEVLEDAGKMPDISTLRETLSRI